VPHGTTGVCVGGGGGGDAHVCTTIGAAILLILSMVT